MEDKNFDLLNLYKLQLSDSRIASLEREVEKLKASEELKAREEELKEVVEAHNGLLLNYNELEKERKKLDDELSMKNEKIKKNEQKLSSGTITSSKEIVNYQEEIVSIRKVNEEIENKIIEIMIRIDDINESIKLENEKKEKISSHVDKLKEEISNSIRIIEEKLSKYIQKRDNILKLSTDDLITKYNEVKEKRGGIAIGILKERMCMACNMEMSSGEALKMSDFNEIYKCPICKRMIIRYRAEVDPIIEEFKD
ncbi:MAG: zinc ribbon domain-containing protein [Candidatus Humimicrobiaceae bacterium]